MQRASRPPGGCVLRRFTDTLKWDDPWFRQLPGVQKLVFLYVIDRCNNAGFWEVDEDAIAWHTKVDRKHLEGAWKGLERGIKGASGWVWVRRFLKHQKNEPLTPHNPAHKQILMLIKDQVERFKDCPEFKEFVGPYMGLLCPIGIGTGTGKGKKRESAEREKSDRPTSREEVRSFVVELGIPLTDGDYYWDKWSGNGFKNNRESMKDWRAVIRSHKSAGFLPSQKVLAGAFGVKQQQKNERDAKLEAEIAEARRKYGQGNAS